MGYDAVYEAMPRGKTLLRLWKQHSAGEDYPDEFYHISFVRIPDLRRQAEEMRISSGSRFADVACGMGGPALWIARETGADLTGVDFSSVAVQQATKRAESLGMSGVARFVHGSFAETGLETGLMDAAMTIDALQYAPDKRAAIREFARILRPGGRLAFYAFELDPEHVAGLPSLGEDPVSDYRPLLAEAGFNVISYEETPGWRERVRSTYQSIVDAQADVMAEMGPLATAALMSELTLTLQGDIYSGRVFVVAERA
jgi:ubiquinone/menaquinone biosynthesis C-methylase UbiE